MYSRAIRIPQNWVYLCNVWSIRARWFRTNFSLRFISRACRTHYINNRCAKYRNATYSARLEKSIVKPTHAMDCHVASRELMIPLYTRMCYLNFNNSTVLRTMHGALRGLSARNRKLIPRPHIGARMYSVIKPIPGTEANTLSIYTAVTPSDEGPWIIPASRMIHSQLGRYSLPRTSNYLNSWTCAL